MATLITEECIVCGACEDECPTQAIRLGDSIFVVDPERCTECLGVSETRKCDEACPVACCVIDPQRVEGQDALLARARALGCDGASPQATHGR